jgi:hypothetical protein
MQGTYREVTACGACGRRLRWEKRVGEELQVWIGVCLCGWLRAIYLHTVVGDEE